MECYFSSLLIKEKMLHTHSHPWVITVTSKFFIWLIWETERETEKHQFVVPLICALLGCSGMCPDWGSNLQHWHIRTKLLALRYLTRATVTVRRWKNFKGKCHKVYLHIENSGYGFWDYNKILLSLECLFYESLTTRNNFIFQETDQH